ncbi:MAG: hypothetical protein AAF899_02825 [Pseudomonadota bacterium]
MRLPTREITAPFIAGVIAGFGIMTAHVPTMLEIVGEGVVLMTAGCGAAACFAVVMQRMPGLSMSRVALLAAAIGTAMTFVSTLTEEAGPGLQAETPEDPAPRSLPPRLAPNMGSITLPDGSVAARFG